MPEFIHLHNHTHFSLLDAICTVDGLVDAAVENNMPAVALTDHGVMYGAMEFYKKAKAKGIKPIIGIEAYVSQTGSRHDRGQQNKGNGNYVSSDEIESANADGLTSSSINYAHLILLAKNESGYKNLIKLCSIGHTEGFYYKPRLDLEVLNQYRDGLVAMSACAGGIISCYITRDDMETARKMTGIYKDIFGDDFYLEIQNHLTIDSEKKVLREMPVLAREFGLKLIATNDVHYIKKEHAVAHNIYLNISAKQNRNNDNEDITTNLRYGTDQIYFKSSDEMCELFKDYPEAICSTLEVTEKCNLELDTSKNFMPQFPLPEGEESKSFDEYLEKLSYEGMRDRIGEITPEVEERLRYELDVIKKMDYTGYFLIVQDLIKKAKDRGILVGPGRGSDAGSLVCYCIGVTDVNPLEYNLLFERFLNLERISMPDIDIDFQDDRRDEVIQYAKEKYGENSVAQIVTFNKLAPRGVLKDVGRVLNFPYTEINELTKLVPILFGKVKPLTECLKEVPDFGKYFKSGPDEQNFNRKNLFEYSSVLENLNKNASLHASGIVIAPSEVTDYVPLSKATGEDNVFCTQYDMNQLEDAGMIKIDFLGLKELKIIKRTLDLINKKHDINLTTGKIPLDDKKTYELFSSGSTIGIFQFSNSKMREYLAKLKPENINDLAAMTALYRPGPMKLMPEFIEKRIGRKKTTYMHPLMENALKETYGVIVYQEQVMQIAREVAGFTMAQADNMRKAMGKKIKEKMRQFKKDFINGAVSNKVPKKTATEIFNLILDFADYGFNKSHGVAYSILAYYTAYLKTHYPLEFLAVSMECRKDSETELQLFADECMKMKIKLRQPDINLSYLDFKVKYSDDKNKTGEIIYGLSAIRNVGVKASDNIIQEREENGEYTGFIDFLKRVDLRLVNKKALEGLIFAGAFDEIEKNRRRLFLNLERATLYAQRFKETPESKGQEGLFSSEPSVNGVTELILENYDEFSDVEKYKFEKSSVGFYLTGHPLELYREDIDNNADLSFGDDVNEIDFSNKDSVIMCGVISEKQERISKKGHKFVLFKLGDFYGSGECIAFKDLLESKKDLFNDSNLVYVKGKAEENGDKIKVIVDDIDYIWNLKYRQANNLTINIFESRLKEEDLSQIKELLEKYQGECNLFFNLINNGSNKVYRSRELKIKVSNELISNLKNIVGENNLKIN